MKDLTGLNWQRFTAEATSSTDTTKQDKGEDKVEDKNEGKEKNKAQPCFYRGWLDIDGEPHDTYIHPQSWGKGVIFINGFNIGRFWNAGPQFSLYIPAPLLRQGRNEILIFEEMALTEQNLQIDFTDHLITKFIPLTPEN